MSRRYLCVHCDHRFEHEGQKQARCPKCMRKGGLEAIESAKQAGSASRPSWILPLVVVSIVGLVAGGYALWAGGTPEGVSGEAPLRPLDAMELRGHLRNAQTDRPELVALFEADAVVEAFAEEAAEGGSKLERARALVEAIRARAAAQAFVPWSMYVPRETDLLSPSEVLEAIAPDAARAELYPLEVALLAAVA
ncbi:MAG: hypothetical protein OEY14_15785, partial [Myxococcales bacterium]|nr:hypothetical protein [Myxococcales bacterium]